MQDETLYRSFEIRAEEGDTRTVVGIAAPYGEVIDHGGSKETFARGAFSDVESGKPLFYQHDHLAGGMPIGVITDVNDTEEGLEIKARFSETPKGNEVYTLVRDGALKSFSVGFVPQARKRDGEVTVWTRAALKEVSVVLEPAYSKAAITEVRSADENSENPKENVMTETPNSEVVELREAVETLDREVRVLKAGRLEVNEPAPQFRSGGEFLKALFVGDDRAKTFVRSYTGATTVDTNAQTGWAQRTVRLVDENRDVLNLFAKAPHPGAISVTLPVLGSTSGTVAATAEGADLPYLEVIFDDVTFNNATYGGYSQLTRQAIELGSEGYLSKVLEYQALQYAKATNAAVRSALTSTTGTATGTLEANTIAGWMATVSRAASTIKNNGSGVRAQFMLVSEDVFESIAFKQDTTGRPVFELNGDGSNTLGNANLVTASANVLGLPVVVDPALADESCYVLNREAITVMESAGAPVRLQDENIINLSKDFSLYGYMIVAPLNKQAIVKVDCSILTP